MSNTKKYNRRVYIVAFNNLQNDIGSPVREVVAAWQMWAHVNDRSGFITNDFQQQVYEYRYEVSVRFERTRRIGSTYYIYYDDKILKIESLSLVNEAYRAEVVMRCIAIDDQSGTGEGGSVTPLPQIGVYNFFLADFNPSVIAGRFVFWAGVDGLYYVILRETGTPIGKQVLNIKATGAMTWGIDPEPTQELTLLYI